MSPVSLKVIGLFSMKIYSVFFGQVYMPLVCFIGSKKNLLVQPNRFAWCNTKMEKW